MPRYRLTIAYDGTDFHGWQRQEPPQPGSDPALGAERPRVVLRTVQEVVQRAAREVVREPVIVQGASRTDAGVHARGQVAAFTCSGEDGEEGGGESAAEGAARGGGWPISRGAERLVRALNSRLPDDVVVMGTEAVGAEFDPVRDCVLKAYSYTLHFSPRGLPPLWDRRYVLPVYHAPDVARMREAAAVLVGEHDFAGFAAAGHGRLTTVRSLTACTVSESAGEDGATRVRIGVEGQGFLWNMVRIIAGTLVEVGRGRMDAPAVQAALESGDRRLAGPTLPASGLCLESVRYE